MSKKNQKVNNETVNNETVNNEVPAEVPAEEPEKLGTKALNWVKKNGKKIGAGALMIGIGIAGYALGTKSNGNNAGSDDDVIDYTALDDEEVNDLLEL